MPRNSLTIIILSHLREEPGTKSLNVVAAKHRHKGRFGVGEE